MTTTLADAAPLVDAARRPPRPWLAALLALVPGLGHLYVGRRRAALVLVALDLALGVLVAMAVMALPGRALALAAPAVALLGFRLWILADAWRSARERTIAWATRKRVALACAAFLLAYVVVQEVAQRLVRARVVEAFRIPSVAMAPTILRGDYVLVAPLNGAPPSRDEVVTYRREGTPYMHRLVGLPGDTLAMVEGVLQRNGAVVREPWALPASAHTDAGAADTVATPEARDWGPFVLGPGEVFVLGDNRDESMDGRHFGPVPMADLLGRPRRVYWSRDPDTGAIRWRRIGVDLGA